MASDARACSVLWETDTKPSPKQTEKSSEEVASELRLEAWDRGEKMFRAKETSSAKTPSSDGAGRESVIPPRN